MKKLIILIISCCFLSGAFAQSPQRQVISAGGGSDVSGKSLLSWTIGQPVVNTTYELSQGFHVPFCSVANLCGVTVNGEKNLTVHAITSEYDLLASIGNKALESVCDFQWQRRGEGQDEWYSIYTAQDTAYMAAFNGDEYVSYFRIIASVDVCDGIADTANVVVYWDNYNLDVVISGNQTICEGENYILLTSAVNQPCTYQWLRNGSAIEGATADTYLPTEPGEYTLAVYNPNGIEFLSNTVVVEYILNPIVYAGEDLTVCSTDAVVLSQATAENCASILWEVISGEGTLYNNTDVNAVFIPAQDYIGEVVLRMLGYAAEPCDIFAQDEIVITCNSEPSMSAYMISDVNNGISFDVEANHFEIEEIGKDASAYDYYWSLTPSEAGNLIINNDVAELVWNADWEGDVTVSVVVSSVCGVVDDLTINVTRTIDNTPQGIEDGNFTAVNLYPNPNNGTFNIEVADFEGEFNVEVYNYAGQIVYNATHNADKVEISLPSAAAGVYFVRLTNNGNTIVQRVVVK